ncbi:MAG TPA: triple tyrosine motif-containing protein [Bacteroidia bacterium]|nr:triple tyrosine motif-containing protein [Bacteroidia bacterium]
MESNLKITSVRINKHDVNWASLVMNHLGDYSKLNEEGLPDNLELKFKAKEINFIYKRSSNSNLTYLYKLEGLHKNWVQTDTSSWINFVGLKHGRYRLLIRELENNHIIKEVSYSFYNNLNIYFIGNDIIGLLIASLIIYFTIKLK